MDVRKPRHHRWQRSFACLVSCIVKSKVDSEFLIKHLQKKLIKLQISKNTDPTIASILKAKQKGQSSISRYWFRFVTDIFKNHANGTGSKKSFDTTGHQHISKIRGGQYSAVQRSRANHVRKSLLCRNCNDVDVYIDTWKSDWKVLTSTFFDAL